MSRRPRWIRRVSLLFVVALSVVIIPTSSHVFAVNSNANDYWPLPTAGSNLVYWWKYRWFPTDGLSSQPGCGTLPQAQYAAISAQYFNDGAFGTSSPNLLSLNYFKDNKCAYWEPLSDRILRTYIDDYLMSSNSIPDLAGNSTQRAFLSAKGHSEWLVYRDPATQCVTGLTDNNPNNTSTRFYKPGAAQPTFNINGRYAQNVDDTTDGVCSLHFTFAGGYRASFESGGTPIPNYSLMPRNPFNGNIYLSKGPNPWTIYDRQLLYRILPTADGWNQMRSNTHPAEASKYYFEWGMWIRQTSMTYQGHPVMYIGFSEPAVDIATGTVKGGACEEWWVAQGVGPIYIARYTDGYTAGRMNNSSLANCRDHYLAVNAVDPNMINNPETHFQNNKSARAGYLKIEDYCVSAGCKVDY